MTVLYLTWEEAQDFETTKTPELQEPVTTVDIAWFLWFVYITHLF